MRKPDAFEKMVELAAWTDEYGCLHLKFSTAIKLLRRQHAKIRAMVKLHRDYRATLPPRLYFNQGYLQACDDFMAKLKHMKKGKP